MKERIARQVGPERARHLWMGTFHSMFLRILHVEAGYIGFTSQFTIYDTADSKSSVSYTHLDVYKRQVFPLEGVYLKVGDGVVAFIINNV